jgi:hypothetical protein
MSNVNSLLSQRLKKGDQSSKMAAMARQSANGNLTSFSGIFSVTELSESEKSFLEEMLKSHSTGEEDVDRDLRSLISLTCEVKAITNQAAILHGERIKKAQTLLKRYRDGAFSGWLLAAYGNRQTPYNFLQYYEFHEAIPKPLRPQLELMPRQAVYTLASRDGSLDRKQEIVENYKGQTKAELLLIIRDAFPLLETDKRKENVGDSTILTLKRLYSQLSRKRVTMNKTQKETITQLLKDLQKAVS